MIPKIAKFVLFGQTILGGMCGTSKGPGVPALKLHKEENGEIGTIKVDMEVNKTTTPLVFNSRITWYIEGAEHKNV